MIAQIFEFIGNHYILVSVFIFLLVAFIINEGKQGGVAITPSNLVNLVNREGAVIVDIRDNKEFGNGHIAGALNIPFTTIDKRSGELSAYREKPIVLVCKMGQHAGSIGKKLRSQGFEDVRRLSGGDGRVGGKQFAGGEIALLDQQIIIYTKKFCPFCSRARDLLSHKGLAYKEISVDRDFAKQAEVFEKSGRRTVPQIWIGSTHVGGCDELFMLERTGQLDSIVMGELNE